MSGEGGGSFLLTEVLPIPYLRQLPMIRQADLMRAEWESHKLTYTVCHKSAPSLALPPAAPMPAGLFGAIVTWRPFLSSTSSARLEQTNLL